MRTGPILTMLQVLDLSSDRRLPVLLLIVLSYPPGSFSCARRNRRHVGALNLSKLTRAQNREKMVLHPGRREGARPWGLLLSRS